jgi:DNA polymerase-3 subunit gamma/tau
MAKKEQTEHTNYLVFARKFRPQAFEEIVGQEPIATTLKNAISKNRIAQSFLFTGPRGVGKTSTARILAKALNCENGPAAEPCNKCSACTEITNGNSLDVLEIDGASNRGIEEIRSLRENVKFKPASGRFKVYIIDEVHMLTGEAFNALLKTLEEPPEHVKFIFATTEVHKVPLTILSRCQRFNFKRIPTNEIAQKLKEITKKEKIKASEKVLFMIAKAADGSLRDGESLLDQLTSFSDGEIKESDVIFSLGLTAEDIYADLLNALKQKNSEETLKIINRITSEGADLVQFARGMLELFRDLLVTQAGGSEHTMVEGTAEWCADLKKFSGFFSREELLFSLALLQQLVRDIRWSQTPRFLVEICLLKISNRSDLRSLESILEEVKALRQSGGTTGKGGENFSDVKPVSTVVPEKKKVNFQPEKTESTFIPQDPAQPTQKNTFSASAIKEPAIKVAEKVRPAEEFLQIKPSSDHATEHKKKETAGTVTASLNDVGRVWPDLLERVKAIKMSCGTYLSEAEPVEAVEDLVVFGLPAEFKFHKESLESRDNKDLVRTTLNSLLGYEVRVSFVVTETGAAQAAEKPKAAFSQKDHDIITSALGMFEGSKVVYRDF